MVNVDFSHDNRRSELTNDQVAENVKKVNLIKFSNEFIWTLRVRLLLSLEETRKYLVEYKKFILMITCSRYISTPSEQVDHVWHLH